LSAQRAVRPLMLGPNAAILAAALLCACAENPDEPVAHPVVAAPVSASVAVPSEPAVQTPAAMIAPDSPPPPGKVIVEQSPNGDPTKLKPGAEASEASPPQPAQAPSGVRGTSGEISPGRGASDGQRPPPASCMQPLAAKVIAKARRGTKRARTMRQTPRGRRRGAQAAGCSTTTVAKPDALAYEPHPSRP